MINMLDSTRRRRLVFGLNAASLALLLLWLARIMAQDGLQPLDFAAIAFLLLAAHQPIFAAWNAAIATFLIARDQDRLISEPETSAGETPECYVAMCVRHENTRRALNRLLALREQLHSLAPKESAQFKFAVLSDSEIPSAILEEEAAFTAMRAALSPAIYRRRATNDGFKGGNLRSFAREADAKIEFAFILDADGAIDAKGLLRMLAIMQAKPKLALLQSLIDPAPGETAFTRLLRWSARVSVRSWYLGQAWWQQERGPSGGHGLLLRLPAFREIMDQTVTAPGPAPLGGPVLGHDHLEAAALADAGYEVRLWPEHIGSYEDHPNSLQEWLMREARWSISTLQYAGLAACSAELSIAARARLALWAAHHLSWSALTPAIALLCLSASMRDVIFVGLALLALAAAPRFAAYYEAAMREGVALYGGARHFIRNAALDLLFCALLALTTPLAVLIAQASGIFQALTGARKPANWAAQQRVGGGARLGRRFRALGLASTPEERRPSRLLTRIKALDEAL